MENFAVRWLNVRKLLKERFGKTPDLEGMLYLIGINELNATPTTQFSKEQKQDLMHIGVCTLLSQVGFYRFTHRDEDGWPHFEQLKKIDAEHLKEQEQLLKECAIRYFE